MTLYKFLENSADTEDTGARKYYEMKLNLLDVGIKKLVQDGTPNVKELELHIAYHKLEGVKSKLEIIEDAVNKTKEEIDNTTKLRLAQIDELENKIKQLRGDLKIPDSYKKRLFT